MCRGLIGVAVRFSAVVTREGDLYVALCPELDVVSQGATVEDALSALREAIGLYLEDEEARLPDWVCTRSQASPQTPLPGR